MAKRFAFRLSAVLRVRRVTLEQRQRTVAERLGLIHAAQETAARARRCIDEQMDAARRALSGGVIQVEQIVWDRHLIARLRRGLVDANQTIEQHRRQLIAERRALLEAHKAVRSLERLEDNQRDAHRVAAEREERIEQDERGTLRYGIMQRTEVVN